MIDNAEPVAQKKRGRSLGLLIGLAVVLVVSAYQLIAVIATRNGDAKPGVLGVTSPDSTLSFDAAGILKDPLGNYLFPEGNVNVTANFATGALNKVESVEAIIHYDPTVLSAQSVAFNQTLSTQFLKQDAMKCNPVYIQKDNAGNETGTIKIARTAIPLPTQCPPAVPPADPPGGFPSYTPIPLNAEGAFASISFTTLKSITTPSLISYEFQPSYPNPTDALNDSNASAYIEPKTGEAAETLNAATSLSFLVGSQPPPPSDTVPPSVELTAPANGATISGITQLTANAADEVGVANVTFSVDGDVKCTDTDAPFTCLLDTSEYTNSSSHSIEAKASDTASPANTAVDSVIVSICNGDCANPSTPTNLEATQNLYNKVSLSWTAATDDVGVVGYYVYRKRSADAQFSQIGTSTSTIYADSTVNSNTDYSYQVKAYDAAQNFSNPSNTVSVTTPTAPDSTPPNAPQGLVGTAISTSQINLNWQAATDNTGGSGIAGYNVFGKKSSASTFTKLNSSLVSSTTYGDSALLPSTTYSYYVTAVDNGGNESPASATINVTTLNNVVSKGIIAGVVVDDYTGYRLPNIKVTASSAGNVKLTTYTSNNGNYSFLNVAPGVYSVSFRSGQYYSETASVTVLGGKLTILNMIMTIKGTAN